MSVYRPRRLRGLSLIAVGIILFTPVTLYVSDGAPRPSMGAAVLILSIMVLPGGLALIFGTVLLTTIVVTVNEHGLRRSPLWWDGFEVAWDEIESWSELRLWSKPPRYEAVQIRDSFTLRAARFIVRGRGRPVVILDSEAWRPSFDTFLEDVRVHVRDKEEVC